MQTQDNRTWIPAGWTPTTTSPRFQLVSQVARLDANGGCSHWGDRSFAFRRRSPYFGPIVVVADLAAPSQRALRPRSSLCSPPPCSPSLVAPAQMLALRHRVFFLHLPLLSVASPLRVVPPCRLVALRSAPSPLISVLIRLSSCPCHCSALRKFPFRLEDASRQLTPVLGIPHEAEACTVGWLEKPTCLECLGPAVPPPPP